MFHYGSRRIEKGHHPSSNACEFILSSFSPWFVCFELISYFGKPPDAVDTYFGSERSWPVLPWAEPLYFSTYIAVLLFPLLARSARGLRMFGLLGYIAMAAIFPLYLLLPYYVPPRPFVSTTLVGSLLQWERSSISGAAALPSFHVVWTCIVASSVAGGLGWRKLAVWIWAVLVAASCAATGMHSIADVVAGFVAFVAVLKMPAIWRSILRAAEQFANSWREWRVGPVRIINHGAYAGAAAAVGTLIIDSLLGPGDGMPFDSICICSLVGAALWAQWVEGSPTLLRPLGFYGGGSAPWPERLSPLRSTSPSGARSRLYVSPHHGFRPWAVFAALSRDAATDAPPIRSRRSATPIRAREFAASQHLAGCPSTRLPVYSILWNVLTGAALLPTFQFRASAAFLCGVYLLLSGLGRFVEEAYRGEPQTRSSPDCVSTNGSRLSAWSWRGAHLRAG